jgi:hypothetical protein
MPRQFVEKWVLNGRDDSVGREIDTIRSGYPPASISGLQFFSGVLYFTAAEFTWLLSIPSTKVFRLNRMIVDNDNAAPNTLKLYNYPSASTLSFLALAMKIAGSQTEFIDNLDVPFRGGASGGIMGSVALASLWVRLQGILVTSD